MKKLLHVTSSARGAQSYSRRLSQAIVQKLMERQDIDTVVERDLVKTPPPYLDESLIGEFYKYVTDIQADDQVLTYANAALGELKQADIIVLSTPMYNLGVSALLKAWIDQLVRVGLTYRFNADGTRTGLLADKTVYLAIASGGRAAYMPDGYEFIESYIKAVFSTYLGITDVYTYRVEGTAEKDCTVNYAAIIQGI
ncbi:FMN-dependent NADH-azoreductase [Paraflavitalea pollutisoli]|uniref:FMN-dependent NADH-azoreductase n=1 Tax=Paraflavitalea pollutisoli TaxID=3034143 RepID=UPI0023EB882D|nr:NAD(P)H-dependent oxidoreductase [Paraflavitalea sp. H1-2-19X]